MPAIHSQISPSSEAFRANAERMRGAGRRHCAKRPRPSSAAARTRRASATSPRQAAAARAAGAALDPGSPFLEIGQFAAWGMYDGDIASAGMIAGVGRVEGQGGDDRRQRRHREGRHLLSAHREEASARAGDRAAEQSALHLPGRFRRRESAQPGRGVSRPRAFRPHLLQPGQHVGGRHSADRLRHGLLHGGRRLCAGDVRRVDHGAGTRRRSSWAARRW